MQTQKPSIDPIVQRFIEEAGAATQAFGLGRVVGQIYAYLYFSRNPKNLNDLQMDLAISKGSASTLVRQLEQWKAVRKVWIEGDRKEHYIAEDNFGSIIKRILNDTVAKKINACTELLNEMEEELKRPDNLHNEKNSDYRRFINQRIKKLSLLRRSIRYRRIW